MYLLSRVCVCVWFRVNSEWESLVSVYFDSTDVKIQAVFVDYGDLALFSHNNSMSCYCYTCVYAFDIYICMFVSAIVCECVPFELTA